MNNGFIGENLTNIYAPIETPLTPTDHLMHMPISCTKKYAIIVFYYFLNVFKDPQIFRCRQVH